MSTTEDTQWWDDKLAEATMVVDAIQYARTCGLDVEFTMTFLDLLQTGNYNVAECVLHAHREWDL